MKVRDLSKMPKRKVTVDDILTRSDVAEVVEIMKNKQHAITEVLVIWTQDDDSYFHWNDNMQLSRWVLAIEAVKQAKLEEDGAG